MNEMEYIILMEKKIRSLEKNQYTFDVGSRLTITRVKNWIELFFGVKVIATNSYRPHKKGGTVGLIGHPTRCRRMIITLQLGYSIPLLSKESN